MTTDSYKTWLKKEPIKIQDTIVETARNVLESFASHCQGIGNDQELGQEVHRFPAECDSEGEEQREQNAKVLAGSASFLQPIFSITRAF